METPKKKYRIDIRRSKRGTIIRSFWSESPDIDNWGFVTVYEKKGKRVFKVNKNY